MPDANRTRTNPQLEKAQAERDHDEMDEALSQDERTGAIPRADIPGHEQQGITNQPVEEEERQQEKLPPRGERKGGSHA
jgi:hypothetical protein